MATPTNPAEGTSKEVFFNSSQVLGVNGAGYVSSVSITRPNDTTAYAAGDVIGSSTSSGGAVLTFTSAGPSGLDLLILDSDLRIDLSAVISGMTTFRLHLYSATPGSAYGDNAAWDLPSGDRDSYLGYVDLGTIADVGSTLWVQSTAAINKMVRLATSSTTLYGYLVTVGAFTPSASFVTTVRFRGIAV